MGQDEVAQRQGDGEQVEAVMAKGKQSDRLETQSEEPSYLKQEFTRHRYNN